MGGTFLFSLLHNNNTYITFDLTSFSLDFRRLPSPESLDSERYLVVEFILENRVFNENEFDHPSLHLLLNA